MKDNLPASLPKPVFLDIAKQTLWHMRNIALILSLNSFFFFNLSAQVEPYDIVITEMMIDPNPVVGLPNFEWVEFYNRTDRVIDLKDYKFSSGSTRSVLPTYNLSPGAFVMLCDDEDLVLLSTYGPAIAIRTFPSLTNTGDVARLESPSNVVIHEVVYDRSWYGSNDKDDGGYTLEIINPEEPCLAGSNWSASQNTSGGTPSAINSMWRPQVPNPGLTVSDIAISRADQISITFDRIPDFSLNTNSFSITPSIGILDISIAMDDPRKVFIDLATVLSPSVEYQLVISENIKDCTGKSSGTLQTAMVIRSEPVSPEDLIINEILFNPIGNASDYLELYNRSEKYLSTAGIQIGNIDDDVTAVIKNISTIQTIPPAGFIVLTENKTTLSNLYPSADPTKIIEMDLPSFNNDKGNVTIMNNLSIDPIIIDAFNYTEEMHNPLIDDTDGIALERTDPDAETQLADNWHSAAASSNYGTPTKRNSQLRKSSEIEAQVYLARKTFFPEGHPIDEVLRIVFDLDRSDYVGQISIYDSVGKNIYQVANNVLIGRNDEYIWDGRNTGGVLQNAGVYIIVVRLVTSGGKMITKKLPCVLSRSL